MQAWVVNVYRWLAWIASSPHFQSSFSPRSRLRPAGRVRLDPAMSSKYFLPLWSPRILGIALSLFLALFAFGRVYARQATRPCVDRSDDSSRARRHGSRDRCPVVAPGMVRRCGVHPPRRCVRADRAVSTRLGSDDIGSAADGGSAVSVELAERSAAQRGLRAYTRSSGCGVRQGSIRPACRVSRSTEPHAPGDERDRRGH